MWKCLLFVLVLLLGFTPEMGREGDDQGNKIEERKATVTVRCCSGPPPECPPWCDDEGK